VPTDASKNLRPWRVVCCSLRLHVGDRRAIVLTSAETTKHSCDRFAGARMKTLLKHLRRVLLGTVLAFVGYFAAMAA
jgi:hypothetical protein